ALLIRAGACAASGLGCLRRACFLTGRSTVTRARPPATVGPVRSARPPAAPAAAIAVTARGPPAVAVTARALVDPQVGRLALGASGRRVAPVDPHLHADPAEGGTGLVEAVVDVGAQRVQRHPALAVELRPRHFGAAEAAGALDPDALGAAL